MEPHGAPSSSTLPERSREFFRRRCTLGTALTEYVETVTEIVVFYKVTLHVTLRAQRRFDVTERWGWVGDECPLQSYVPETIEYSLWGKMVEFEFDYVYRYARKGHTVEAATVAQEDLISWAEEQFILDLQRTRGHWMPELPPPHDAPPDIPFHL